MDYLLVAGGLVGLYFGAEWLLRGSIALAHKLAIPTLIVSLVIVGFGTSMPELLVSVRAGLAGSSDIALGNVVGSNTANILLIIGVCALIFPITHWDKGVRRDSYVMIAAAVLLLGLAQFTTIGRLAGLIMVVVLLGYVTYAYINSRGTVAEVDEEEVVKHETLSGGFMALLILGGLATLSSAPNSWFGARPTSPATSASRKPSSGSRSLPSAPHCRNWQQASCRRCASTPTS